MILRFGVAGLRVTSLMQIECFCACVVTAKVPGGNGSGKLDSEIRRRHGREAGKKLTCRPVYVAVKGFVQQIIANYDSIHIHNKTAKLSNKIS